jgi:hypothetical protein
MSASPSTMIGAARHGELVLHLDQLVATMP